MIYIAVILLLLLAMRFAYKWGESDAKFKGRNEMLEVEKQNAVR